jgi:hypothetical protein
MFTMPGKLLERTCRTQPNKNQVYIYNVGKTIVNQPFGIIWEWFIPPVYGDLGDGLLVFSSISLGS